MKSERQILIVGGIVLLGLAVLPFARRAESEAVPRAAESVRVELPLHVPAQIANSPATLHDQDAPPEPPRLTVPSIAASRLEDNGLPPELPERYHPLVDGPPADHVVTPRTLQRPIVPAAVEPSRPAPRTHRVKDGDTLLKLAQYYWNDASLSDRLFEANRAVLAAPDPLPIGVVLQVPEKPISLPKPKQPAATEDSLPSPVRQPNKVDTLDQLPLVPLR